MTAENAYKAACDKVDRALAEIDRANKNAERAMLDVVLDLNRDLIRSANRL